MINLKSCEILNAIEILPRQKESTYLQSLKKSNTYLVCSFSDWDSSIRFQRSRGSLGWNDKWGKSILNFDSNLKGYQIHKFVLVMKYTETHSDLQVTKIQR